VYLPHCYLPRDTSVFPSLEKPERSDFGLPENVFVFCSFNHDYKINPEMFKIWMELLKEVPESVLWLMKLNDTAQANLTKEAYKFDIDPRRIVYATRVPKIEDHLARYQLADLFLDTFPYNGHTTLSDAIYSGLFAVSMFGDTFSSRVGRSLMVDHEQTHGSVNTSEEYKSKAIAIAIAKNNSIKISTSNIKTRNNIEWENIGRENYYAFEKILNTL
jgi:predicted O-linked N-acetylglucosamine transferase (SPINDLY family)